MFLFRFVLIKHLLVVSGKILLFGVVNQKKSAFGPDLVVKSPISVN